MLFLGVRLGIAGSACCAENKPELPIAKAVAHDAFLVHPDLSGITIEMEACTGGAAGERKCADALNGQHLATVSSGIAPLSVLWLTHSESMSPAQQCKGGRPDVPARRPYARG